MKEKQDPFTQQCEQLLDLMEHTRAIALVRMRKQLKEYAQEHLHDCEEELWVLVCEHRQEVLASPNPYGWVSKAADYTALSMYRKLCREDRMRAPISDRRIELAPSAEEDALEDLWAKEHPPEEVFRQVSTQLSSAEKELYQLFYIDKLPMRAIGLRLNKSEDAAKMAVYRVRNKVKRILKSL